MGLVQSHEGSPDQAWEAARPLLEAQPDQVVAAEALAHLLGADAFDRTRGLEVARAIFRAHPEHRTLVSRLADAFTAIHDIRLLNAEPPRDPLFTEIATHLRALLERATDPKERARGLGGLATAARILGRTWDTVAEQSALDVIALEPQRWEHHYNLGLLYKTRGRFAEGQAAYQRAYDLGGLQDESVHWNLGICATGARDAATALHVWKDLFGQNVTLGRFGLPEGSYAPTKVRLAERPIAERAPGRQPDDPGQEETIWIERLSPCHGIVRSALHHGQIGVDFGDLVLIDGAAITHETQGTDQVVVFPHLATLERPGYQIFRFAATQGRRRQVAELSEQLPADAVLYVLTEVDEHAVTGKLCAPPATDAADLLAALDRAVAGAPDVHLYVPDLVARAGDQDRADRERHGMARLVAEP